MGANYFSQQCVFRLAPRAGIQIPEGLGLAEKLKHVQGLLESGHEGARRIWETMGVYMGYGLAHYADFYELKHVLILGRCTSGSGGQLILDGARAVLDREFPEHPRAASTSSCRTRRAGASASRSPRPACRRSPAADNETEAAMKLNLQTAEIYVPDGVAVPRGARAHDAPRGRAPTRTTSRSWPSTAS